MQMPKRVGLDHLPAATGWLLTSSVANNKVGGQRLSQSFDAPPLRPRGAIKPVRSAVVSCCPQRRLDVLLVLHVRISVNQMHSLHTA